MRNHVFERLSEAKKQHPESSFDIILDLDQFWINRSCIYCVFYISLSWSNACVAYFTNSLRIILCILYNIALRTLQPAYNITQNSCFYKAPFGNCCISLAYSRGEELLTEIALGRNDPRM